MYTKPIVRDYFLEFSKLIQNQQYCASLLCEYFQGKDTVALEKQARKAAKDHISEILLQKSEKILPDEKERLCLLLSELLFQSQITILHIPELFRIYSVEHLATCFTGFLPTVTDCCRLQKEFSLPSTAKERFSKNKTEPIVDCCLEGFKYCLDFDGFERKEAHSALESLILKDIDEEFASFFLINLKFTNLALHFPM